MWILDEEVFAVILAITIIGSAIGVVMILMPGSSENFTAIGLLNSECKIGDYPRVALNNTYIDLCIFIANYMNKPILYKVIYKIGNETTLPTNSTPSDSEPLESWWGVLSNGGNTTFPVRVLVASPSIGRVALIFELWIYDTDKRDWVYSGEWVHLYINVSVSLI